MCNKQNAQQILATSEKYGFFSVVSNYFFSHFYQLMKKWTAMQRVMWIHQILVVF